MSLRIIVLSVDVKGFRILAFLLGLFPCGKASPSSSNVCTLKAAELMVWFLVALETEAVR
jgi:hypothetical protein